MQCSITMYSQIIDDPNHPINLTFILLIPAFTDHNNSISVLLSTFKLFTAGQPACFNIMLHYDNVQYSNQLTLELTVLH